MIKVFIYEPMLCKKNSILAFKDHVGSSSGSIIRHEIENDLECAEAQELLTRGA